VGSVLWFANGGSCIYVGFDFATDTWYQLVEHPKLEAPSINAGTAPSKWQFIGTVFETGSAALAAPRPPAPTDCPVAETSSGG
jgi:hypothetical protein